MGDSVTLDENTLAALRRAAVMAHTLGAITLRLTARDAVIVDVVPGLDRPRSTPPRSIDPCGFRLAVARAWADHTAGRQVALIGLQPGDDLHIAWAVAPPGQALGLGSVRAVCGDRTVWAFASLLDPTALADMVTELDGPCPDVAARLVHDDVLDATVVHLEADRPVGRALDETLRRLVAAVGAAEVIERCRSLV